MNDEIDLTATELSAMLEHIRQGDDAALGALFARHHPGIRAVCRRRLRSLHDAEDAVQETYVRALRSLDQLREPEQVGPWLRRIAERVCLDHLRRVPAPIVHLERDDGTDQPEEHALRQETVRRVHMLLSMLNERERRALWLRDGLGAPVGVIAAELGLTEGSARVLLARSRRRMRQLIDAVPVVIGGLSLRLQQRLAATPPAVEQLHGLVPLLVAATLVLAPSTASSEEQAAASGSAAQPTAGAGAEPSHPVQAAARPVGGPVVASSSPQAARGDTEPATAPKTSNVYIGHTPPDEQPFVAARTGQADASLLEVELFTDGLPEAMGVESVTVEPDDLGCALGARSC